MSFIFEPALITSLPIVGLSARFPVHRVFCVGQNYAKHAQEMGASGREAPFFFMKPARSIIPVEADHVQPVPYPEGTKELHHEIELVVAIGREGNQISPENAAEYIYGYATGLDLTRRDLQAELKAKGRPWEIAKGFEASAPIGPITPLARTGELLHADLSLEIDGEVRQQGNMDEMIWSVNEIISALSMHWNLTAGDLIFTGTPSGVGPLVQGNQLQGQISGLQPLQVKVV